MKKINFIFAAAALVCCFTGCNKELDLAHKYDNTISKEPFKEEEEDITDYLELDNMYISKRTDVEVKDGIPRKGFWLDGKISVIRFSWAAKPSIIWSADNSLRLDECESPWLEDNINRLTDKNVFLGTKRTGGFTDGGMWTIGIHELKNGKIAAFFHAESHFPGQSGAYKSIGVSYSTDHGETWSRGDKILSGSEPKPATSHDDGRSYGLGDGCVVYNAERESYICYYSGFCKNGNDYMITMAESKDPEVASGSWKKWDGTDFTVVGCDSKGLGGENYAIEGLAGYHGGNPSVMYDTYLEKWIMVYHSWQCAIIYSESEDGITWSTAKAIITSSMEPGGAMYPNLISKKGDLEGGKQFRVYYAADMDNDGIRTLSYRKISLK